MTTSRKQHVSTEAWSSLYGAADAVHAMAPWQWMEETDIFGVRFPGRDEPAFVSVMGALGQHFGVAAYLGWAALHAFLEMENAPDEQMPERLLEISQLQVSWGERAMLDKPDHEIIRKLGLRFAKNGWPLFRSSRPGFVPWYVEPDEVLLLTTILEQSLDVAGRFRVDKSVLHGHRGKRLLVRARAGDGDAWEDRIEPLPPAPTLDIPIEVEGKLLERLAKLPQGGAVVEADVFMVPAPIGERGARPFLPYSVMLVEAASGFILAAELVEPRPDVTSVWTAVPGKVVQGLLQSGAIPAELRVRSPIVLGMLAPIANAARIKLKMSPRLPALDTAREAMVRHLRGR